MKLYTFPGYYGDRELFLFNSVIKMSYSPCVEPEGGRMLIFKKLSDLRDMIC